MSTQPVDNAPWSRQALPEQLAVPVLVAIYGLISWWVAARYSVASILSADIYTPELGLLLLVAAIVIVSGYLVRIMVFVRPRALIRYLAEDLQKRQKLRERLVLGLPMLVVLPVFFSLFSSMKTLIPLIHPFSWDSRLERIDRWLHGGRAPWEWLQPLLGSDAATTIVNFFYNAWLFIMLTVVCWQAFSAHHRVLRMQFLLCFVLTWSLLGTVLATLFASAGPCFYGRLPGYADAYAPLMHSLQDIAQRVPVWSLSVQEMLWEGYTTAGNTPLAGGGISAMPSLHIATTLMMALLGWRLSRGLGVALTLLLVLIFAGSICLGWHYAIDGYVSLILTPPLWWFSGVMARWLVRPRWQAVQTISE
jgi:hypothetical protein